MKRLTTILVMVMWASVAEADSDDIPPGEDRIVALSSGAAAPFGGQLFDPQTAIRWGNRIERYRLRIRLLTDELELLQRRYQESTDRQLALQSASYVREIEGLRADMREQAQRFSEELAEYRSPPFWKQWGFAFGLGVTLAATLMSIFVVAIQ